MGPSVRKLCERLSHTLSPDGDRIISHDVRARRGDRTISIRRQLHRLRTHEPYIKTRGDYLNNELRIISGLTPTELTLERGRVCAALNGLSSLSSSIYEQVRICREKGVPGMAEFAAKIANVVMTHEKQAKDSGC